MMMFRLSLLIGGCLLFANAYAQSFRDAALDGLARDVSSGEPIYRLRMLASGGADGVSQYGVVCESIDERILARANYELDPQTGQFMAIDWHYPADASRLDIVHDGTRWIARRTAEAQRERVQYPKFRASDVFGWALADVLRLQLNAIRSGDVEEISHIQIPSLRRQSFRVTAHSFWQGYREIQLVQLSPQGWFADKDSLMSFEYVLPQGRLSRYTGPSMCSNDPATAPKVDIRF